MSFLLLLALLTAGPVGGTQTQIEDEMATPNIDTIIEWVRSEYPTLPRIQTTNCRKISGSSSWSQHSWANAADIFVSKAVGDELYARLKARYPEHIKTILWQVTNHYDHIHVDTWPTGTGTPPCGGGALKVRHKDGAIGTVFTNDIKTQRQQGGDEEVRSLRLMVVEAAQKSWLKTQPEIDEWMRMTNFPNDPGWQAFENAWSKWKQDEHLALRAAVTGAQGPKGDKGDPGTPGTSPTPAEVALEIGRRINNG